MKYRWWLLNEDHQAIEQETLELKEITDRITNYHRMAGAIPGSSYLSIRKRDKSKKTVVLEMIGYIMPPPTKEALDAALQVKTVGDVRKLAKTYVDEPPTDAPTVAPHQVRVP